MTKSNHTLIWGNDDSDGTGNETRMNKKQKVYEIYDPLIYVCDGVVHFSSPVNKITIEIVIKLISKDRKSVV